MSEYSVRIRFRLAERLSINTTARKISIADPAHGKEVVLKSAEGDISISEAKHLALVVESYGSEDQAAAAGEWWKGVLQKALASASVGAEFGARSGPSSVVTDVGKPWFRELFGLARD